jgi:hypothetical protein
VTLFDALYAFFQEHQYCGDLDGGVEGDRVWMTCTCGASINRKAQGSRAPRGLRMGLAPLLFPDGETPEVKLKRRTARDRRYLHEPLVPHDDAAAGVARSFPVAVTAPNFWDPVIG